MIEKISFIRKDYELGSVCWENINYVQKIYDETLKSYPMVNFGRLLFYGGVVATVLATTQVLHNPACFIQQIAGLLVCVTGCSVGISSESQFENYIKHREAVSRLRKYGIKKEINSQIKNKEKEF